MFTNKRTAAKLAAALGSALLLTSCGGGEGEGASGGSDAEPFRLGILASYTGPFAAVGPDITEATVRLYLEEHGDELGGRPVEVITGDGKSEPNAYVTEARRLVEDEKVDAIVGIDQSGALLAMRDYLDEEKVPTIINVAAAREITNELKSDYLFRATFTNGQMEVAGAAIAYKALGYEKVALVASDYAGARQLGTFFAESFTALGGAVVAEVYPPLGTTDYGTYLAEIQKVERDVDAVVPIVFGADAARFAEQYRTLGIDLPVFTVGNYVEQTLALDQWGDKAIGTQTWWFYSPLLDNEVNNAFREAYMAKYDRLPGAFSATTWAAMQFLDEAGASGADMSDPDALSKGLENATIDSPFGEQQFDDSHALVLDVFLNEVEDTEYGPAQVPVGDVVRATTQNITPEEAADALTTLDDAEGN